MNTSFSLTMQEVRPDSTVSSPSAGITRTWGETVETKAPPASTPR